MVDREGKLRFVVTGKGFPRRLSPRAEEKVSPSLPRSNAPWAEAVTLDVLGVLRVRAVVQELQVFRRQRFLRHAARVRDKEPLALHRADPNRLVVAGRPFSVKVAAAALVKHLEADLVGLADQHGNHLVWVGREIPVPLVRRLLADLDEIDGAIRPREAYRPANEAANPTAESMVLVPCATIPFRLEGVPVALAPVQVKQGPVRVGVRVVPDDDGVLVLVVVGALLLVDLGLDPQLALAHHVEGHFVVLRGRLAVKLGGLLRDVDSLLVLVGRILDVHVAIIVEATGFPGQCHGAPSAHDPIAELESAIRDDGSVVRDCGEHFDVVRLVVEVDRVAHGHAAVDLVRRYNVDAGLLDDLDRLPGVIVEGGAHVPALRRAGPDNDVFRVHGHGIAEINDLVQVFFEEIHLLGALAPGLGPFLRVDVVAGPEHDQGDIDVVDTRPRVSTGSDATNVPVHYVVVPGLLGQALDLVPGGDGDLDVFVAETCLHGLLGPAKLQLRRPLLLGLQGGVAQNADKIVAGVARLDREAIDWNRVVPELAHDVAADVKLAEQIKRVLDLLHGRHVGGVLQGKLQVGVPEHERHRFLDLADLEGRERLPGLVAGCCPCARAATGSPRPGHRRGNGAGKLLGHGCGCDAMSERPPGRRDKSWLCKQSYGRNVSALSNTHDQLI